MYQRLTNNVLSIKELINNRNTFIIPDVNQLQIYLAVGLSII